MYNVRYKGLTKEIVKPSKYADTIVSPVASTSGSFDLENAHGRFSSIYNSYDKNISVNTVSYLSNLNYNLKCKRLMHWTKIIYKKDEYVPSGSWTKEDGSIRDDIFFYEFKGPMKDREFIHISSEDLYYDIFIWRNEGHFRIVPGCILSYEKEITSDILFSPKNKLLNSQFREIASALQDIGFSCRNDINRLYINWDRPEKENSSFSIEVGRYVEDIQYAGIRFFCRDYVLGFNDAVVTEANDNYVVLSTSTDKVQISNPDPEKYSCVVADNQIVYQNYPLFSNINYSYPNKNKEYKDIDSYDNLKLDELTKLRRTYSVKLSLDWYRENPGKAIDQDQNAYILVNNGLYNSLIWWSKADTSEFEGLIIDTDGPSAVLGKVFSWRSDNDTDKSYTIRFVARDDIRLCEHYSTDDQRYTEITRITERYDNEEKTLNFEWSRFGTNMNLVLVYYKHGFRVVSYREYNPSTDEDIEIDDRVYDFKANSYYDVLKYTHVKAKRNSFRYNGELGIYLEPGDSLFSQELPVVETFDINPNYWYIDEFFDPESEPTEDSPDFSNEDSVRELQLNHLLETLQALGFIVEYDPENYIITLSSYDSLRIVDISQSSIDENGVRKPLFSLTDYINGSYDMMCCIDDEYKVLDLWSKFPTHSPEFRVTFAYSKVAEYNLRIDRLDADDNVISTETHLVSLDIDSKYYIENVLERDSEFLTATVYRYGRIKFGTYRLAREEPYIITPEDKLCGLINMKLEQEPFEIFIDSGILDRGSQFYVAQLLADKFKLCLFDIYDKSQISYTDVLEFENVSWSYPDVIIGEKIYPNYLYFLINNLTTKDFSGEVEVTKLVEEPNDWDIANLMSIYFDNYRYCITHNFIPSRYGAIHAEIALIEARIVNSVYNKINYNTAESQIAIQFNELMNVIINVSGDNLSDIRLDSIVLNEENRRCDMTVTAVYNLFKSDPIVIKTTLVVNYE